MARAVSTNGTLLTELDAKGSSAEEALLMELDTKRSLADETFPMAYEMAAYATPPQGRPLVASADSSHIVRPIGSRPLDAARHPSAMPMNHANRYARSR
jgi:hypothetical protein